MAKSEEPAIGIPYNAAYQFNQAPPPPIPQQYYVGANPYQDGMIPPNAVFGDPKGILIQQTIYRDSPAPFNCLHCGGSGVTVVKSLPSHLITLKANNPMEAKSAIEFYGDFDGSFHKSLDLTVDLSSALLGPRSHRWSAYVVDGNVKVLNVETAPSEFKVSGGDVILGQI